MSDSTSIQAPAAAPAPSRVTVLSFRSGDTWLALPAIRIQEVLRPGSLTPLPRAPAHISGLLNVRGHAVPMVDLGAMLGWRDADLMGDAGRVLLVEDGELRAGVLVAQVGKFLPWDGEARPRGSDTATGLDALTDAHVKGPHGFVAVLSVAALLRAAQVQT